VGFCFTPQDGNSLLSSVAATAWLLNPEKQHAHLEFPTPYLFDDLE
jgi:glyceraldehyde-3-phosphate dehydrogenase (NAD(P))